MTREEEAAVIRRIHRGYTDDFEILVNEYQKTVYNIALRTVGNPEDASDMAQEAFLRAYSSIGSFRGDSKFSVWLYRITTNVCIDFMRSKKKHNEISLSAEDDDGEDIQLDIEDTSASPEAVLERKLTCESVRKGLSLLPEDHRRILILRELGQMSYEEIADCLSLELGTVKSRIFRARKKLCDYLTKDGNYTASVSSGNNKGGESRG